MADVQSICDTVNPTATDEGVHKHEGTDDDGDDAAVAESEASDTFQFQAIPGAPSSSGKLIPGSGRLSIGGQLLDGPLLLDRLTSEDDLAIQEFLDFNNEIVQSMGMNDDNIDKINELLNEKTKIAATSAASSAEALAALTQNPTLLTATATDAVSAPSSSCLAPSLSSSPQRAALGSRDPNAKSSNRAQSTSSAVDCADIIPTEPPCGASSEFSKLPVRRESTIPGGGRKSGIPVRTKVTWKRTLDSSPERISYAILLA